MDEVITEELCYEYIYSEDYLDFIFKYDDVNDIQDRISPACINIINSQFLVAYKKASEFDSTHVFAYGYNTVPKCYGLMDTTVATVVGADIVRKLTGLSLTGRGTLIGFVDTGINYTSSTFINEDGTTRIKSIWDQNESVLGTGPSMYGYGAVYYEDDINRALRDDAPFSVVPSRDNDGHGTFLASVAAGNIVEGQFTGVAPEADIIMVKLKEAKKNLRDFYLINEQAKCYSENDIMLGLKFLLSEAQRLGRPMAICIGLGTNGGDHNGNTNLEMYFDIIQNLRGICSVSSAGNELGYGGHYTGDRRISSMNMSENMEIYVGPDNRGFTLEIWGNAPGILKVTLMSPTGEKFSNISSIKNESTLIEFLYEGTKVYVENVAIESQSGDQMIFMRFDAPSDGIWTIGVTETVLGVNRGFDAWLPIHEFLNADATFVRGEPDVTICAPGNSRGVITAAGYNHYNNSLYVNSSRGYTRKGNIKPDICAPAVDVYGVFATSESQLGKEQLYSRMDGTSIAAAITAGAASLILEWGFTNLNIPYIDTPIIKQMIIRGANESKDITYPNEAWGWGVLDIFGVFEAIRENV
ncbi:MAG: S8 family peptidase [Lachnospiraceae bacterium]|nr:S8 family peptidase [Lachnospiraceae bacterium]